MAVTVGEKIPWGSLARYPLGYRPAASCAVSVMASGSPDSTVAVIAAGVIVAAGGAGVIVIVYARSAGTEEYKSAHALSLQAYKLNVPVWSPTDSVATV